MLEDSLDRLTAAERTWEWVVVRTVAAKPVDGLLPRAKQVFERYLRGDAP